MIQLKKHWSIGSNNRVKDDARASRALRGRYIYMEIQSYAINVKLLLLFYIH